MEALAFIHSAIAYEDPSPTPQLRSWNFAHDLSTPLLLHLAGAATVSALLLTSGTALAQTTQRGDQGLAVVQVQRLLGIPADGEFGPETEAAVRTFQQQNGLTVDGVVGPETLQAMQSGTISGNTAGGGGDRTPPPARPAEFVYQAPPSVAVASSTVPPGYRGTAIVRTNSGQGVNVRATPNGQAVAGIDDGTRVQLTGEQATAGGRRWARLSQQNGWVATDFLVPVSGGGGVVVPPGGGGSGSDRLPFVVAVPGDSVELLRRVRRQVPGAFFDRNRRGAFIHAGTFQSRSLAERLSRELRDSGLDARVASTRLGM